MQATTPIKLSQLTGSITTVIENAFRDMHYWVIADVTNHSFRQEKGYHNFELVEKDSGSSSVIAKIAGKSWGNGAKQLAAFEQATGQRFTNNIQVLVLVAIEYHPLFGMSASVLDIDQGFTLGVLEQQRKATLQKLVEQNDFIQHSNGEFKTANKELKLGRVIQSIAHLSSSISAGAEDFRHTLDNNSFGYSFRVDDYFASVQGDRNAGQFLDKLIGIFNSGIAYDAVVITRGGGAQTDFLIFDNYRIARAIAKFPIPVITGIGHHKNESIIDLMAHTQTKTPTKAAEFIIAHNRKFEDTLLTFQKDILIASQQLISAHVKALSDTKQEILHGARDIIAKKKDRTSAINQKITGNARSLLFSNSHKLLRKSTTVASGTKMILQNRKNDLKVSSDALQKISLGYLKGQTIKIENFGTTIRLMSPANILKKGYAIVKVGGQVVSNANDIEKGTTVEVLFSDTTLYSTVQEKKRHHGTDNNL
jgi:exodeoxyribonuclease VII large subunit